MIPEAQAAYFRKFHGQGLRGGMKRKWKGVDVGARQGFITLRYREVALQFFAAVWHVAVSLDASRVGGQDLLCGVLAATVASVTRCAWAPPQVLTMTSYV